MAADETGSKQRLTPKGVYRFLGGAALGTFVIAVPFSYGSSFHLNLVQIAIASGWIIGCGLLTSVWGEKFIDMVARMLNGTNI
jgi:hypothetical protein